MGRRVYATVAAKLGIGCGDVPLAPLRGHGRDHGADGLRRHQRHLEHRNRGDPHARCPHSDATPRPQLRQEASLTPPWHPARAPRGRRARTLHGTYAQRRESRSTHAAAAAAAATGQHHARPRRLARQAHRARSHCTAPRSSAAALQAPDSTHEPRRTTTKRCCVSTRTQSRRRRSMGHAKTWCSPRQRGPVARAGGASFFLPCERGLNSHTDVITRPHLSLAL